MIEKLIQEFVGYADKNNLPIEGIAAGDEKRVIFEHHFTPDRPRNIYSHTKSFMSTAVGIAVSEGKLDLEDKLTDYFPEDIPLNSSKRLEKIRLLDLLTMSSGFGKAYLMGDDRRNGVGFPDYMKYMLSQEVLEDPGTRFYYSTADSVLAGRMVEKAVGMRLSQYLYERLLCPMHIEYPIWDNDPQGHPIGGGGMFLKLTDMMKLGQLYLANGMWEGRRLVESGWIQTATSKHIETDPDHTSDDIWNCGYGYQFWMSPYKDSCRADGAFGQITTILPDSGYVIAVRNPEVSS